MKNVKYFLFSLLCMFCSCLAFAKDEITIEKMIPVYDENSSVIVSEENGVHSVVFNDKDQNVKYNIVLKNNTKRDISLKDIVLPESPEEFFKYEFVGIDEKTVLEPNSTEEVVLSLETVKTEGWGRNFTLDLNGRVEVLDSVVNRILNKNSLKELESDGFNIIKGIEMDSNISFDIDNCYVSTVSRDLIKECLIYYNLVNESMFNRPVVEVIEDKKFNEGFASSIVLIVFGIVIILFSCFVIYGVMFS